MSTIVHKPCVFFLTSILLDEHALVLESLLQVLGALDLSTDDLHEEGGNRVLGGPPPNQDTHLRSVYRAYLECPRIEFCYDSRHTG